MPDPEPQPAEAPQSVETRLAVLEERTAPKPKSPIDHLKEWGGVATLVVALLYTFPLGVWDRFILTPKARVAAERAALRETALALADIDADYAVRFDGLKSQETRTFYSRAVSSKKYTIFTKNADAIERYAPTLEAAEIVLFAYTAGQAGRIELAERLFDAALVKAEADADVTLVSDIFRLKGALATADPNGIDLDRVRANYSQAVDTLKLIGTEGAGLQSSNSYFEWALFEMHFGDWGCGEALRDKALGKISGIQLVSPETEAYRAQYQQQFMIARQRPGQPADGCPKDIAARLD